MTSYEVPTPLSSPVGVYVVPSGDVWICEFLGQKIAKFDPTTKQFTEYPVPLTLLGPAVVRAFTGGKYLWFTAIATNAIGRIDITTGAFKTYLDTANVGVPIEDTNDKNGNVCEYNECNNICPRQAHSLTFFPRRVLHRPLQHPQLHHPEHGQNHRHPAARQRHHLAARLPAPRRQHRRPLRVARQFHLVHSTGCQPRRSLPAVRQSVDAVLMNGRCWGGTVPWSLTILG